MPAQPAITQPLAPRQNGPDLRAGGTGGAGVYGPADPVALEFARLLARAAARSQDAAAPRDPPQANG